LKEQNGKCTHCGLYFREDDLVEIDHIIPTSLGGKDRYQYCVGFGISWLRQAVLEQGEKWRLALIEFRLPCNAATAYNIIREKCLNTISFT
jgi:hypothetical protein